MDWKEALSAARSNFNEVPNEETDTPAPEVVKNSLKQTSPLYIVVDKKGRNGKTATIIEGFSIPQNEVEEIATKLKQKLGVGGSVRQGEILVQGNHSDKVKKILQDLKFKVK